MPNSEYDISDIQAEFNKEAPAPTKFQFRDEYGVLNDKSLFPKEEIAPLEAPISGLLLPLKESLDVQFPDTYKWFGNNIVHRADFDGEIPKAPPADSWGDEYIVDPFAQFLAGGYSAMQQMGATALAGTPEAHIEKSMAELEDQMTKLGAQIGEMEGTLIPGEAPSAGISSTTMAGQMYEPGQIVPAIPKKTPESIALSGQLKDIQNQYSTLMKERDYWRSIREGMVKASQTGWLEPPPDMNMKEYIARTMGAAGASTLPAVAAGIVAGPGAGALLLGNVQGMDAYFESRDAGMPIEEARRIMTMETLFSTALEFMPLDNLFKLKGNAIERFIKQGTVEAAQEVTDTIKSNLIAMGEWDENRDLFDNTFEALVGGLGSGGPMGAVATDTTVTPSGYPQILNQSPVELPAYIANDLKKSKEVAENFEVTDAGWDLKEGQELTREKLADLISLNTGIGQREADLTLRVMVDQIAQTKGLTSEEYLSNLTGVVFDRAEFARIMQEQFKLEQEQKAPFALKIAGMLSTGRSKLPISTPLSGTDIMNRLNSLEGVSKLELDYFKSQGMEEFLAEKKRTPFELSNWMQERAPKIEIKEIPAVDSASAYDREAAEFQHYLDTTLTTETRREQAQKYIEGLTNRDELLASGWTEEEFDVLNRHDILLNRADRDNAPYTIPNDSATARYTMVNPKPLAEMPGAVDLLVRIPFQREKSSESPYKNETYENYIARLGIGDTLASRSMYEREKTLDTSKYTRPKYSSGHYPKEGANLVTHVRGYMEEIQSDPDPKTGIIPPPHKVFHVFEIQSDWAQQRREELKRFGDFKRYIVNDVGLNKQGFNLNFTSGSIYISEKVANKFGLQKEGELTEDIRAKLAEEFANVQDDVLLNIYNELGVKAAIQHAIDNGADAIAISDANTAMLTEGHDRYTDKTFLDGNFTVETLKGQSADYVKGPLLTLTGRVRVENGEAFLEVSDGQWRLSNELLAENGVSYEDVLFNRELIPQRDVIRQEEGMRVNYDRKLPKIAEKLTKEKGKFVSFGKHQNVLPSNPISDREWRVGEYFSQDLAEEANEKLLEMGDKRQPTGKFRVNADPAEGSPDIEFELHNGEWVSIDSAPNRYVKFMRDTHNARYEHRKGLILRDYKGDLQTDIIAREYDLSKFKEADEPLTLFQKGAPSEQAGGVLQTPQILKQFIGEQAQRSDPKVNSKYRQALQMEQDGVPMEEIRNTTGWFKLPQDNKWRLPTSDKFIQADNIVYQSLRRNEGQSVPLEDIYINVHPENKSVLDYYGNILKNVRVYVKPLYGKLGEYNRLNKTITLDTHLYGDVLNDTLRHEVQHAIGHIEGFLYEGRPSHATEETVQNRALQEKVEKLKLRHEKLVQEWQTVIPPPRLNLRSGTSEVQTYPPGQLERLQAKKERLQKVINNVHAELEDINKIFEHQKYRMQLGEVEAFSAEKHASYSDEALKTLHPFPIQEGTMFYSIDANSGQQIKNMDDIHGLWRQNAKGAVGMMQDGRMLLGLFETADVSTLVHEFAHVATQYLGADQAKVLAEWAGVEYSLVERYLTNRKSLNKEEFEEIRKFEEKFAVGFEKYLRTGRAPVASLKRIFRLMKEWLSRIYATARSGALKGIVIPDRVKAVYDSLLLGEEERFGGTIKSVSLTEPLRVTQDGANAVVVLLVNGKRKAIPVDNLVKGQAPTKTQKQLWGPDVKWTSPFEAPMKAIQEEFRAMRNIGLNEAQVGQMNQKELERLAKFLGIPNAKEFLPDDRLRTLLMTIAKNNPLLDVKMAESLEEAETKAALNVDSAKLPTPKTARDKTLAEEGVAYYVLDLIARVENSANVGEFGKLTASEARRAIDNTRKFIGEHKTRMNKILELARGALLNLKKNAHLAELQRVEWDPDKRWGRSIFQLAVEGKYDLNELSPLARELVTEFQALVRETGLSWEDMGMKITDQDGKQIPFKASETGEKLIRRFTPDMWRILTTDGIEGERLRIELSEIMALVAGDATLQTKIKKRIDSLRNQVNNRHINQETMRFFDDMPTHVRFMDGTEVQLLHTDPMNVASRMVYEMGLRAGFVSRFGQADKVVDRYVDAFQKAGGRPIDIHRLFRALNGLPLNDTTRTIPGSPKAKALDRYEAFLNIWKPAKLGLASINNTLETIGKIPAYAGMKNYLTALKKLLHASLFDRAELKRLTDFVEGLDGLTTDVESLYLLSEGKQPMLKHVKKLTRILGQKFSYLSGMVQTARMNEMISAIAAEEMVQKLLKGKGNSADVERLKLLKFSDAEIETLMNSKKRLDLHNAVVSRSPSMTQGTNLLPAQRSVFHNEAWAKDVVGFDGYFVNTLRRAYDVSKRLTDTYRNGTAKEKAQATKVFGEYFFGHSMSGIMQRALRSMIKYGPVAWFWADWDDEDDGMDVGDIAKLLKDGMVYAMWGGPASYIFEQMIQKRGRIDANAIASATLPYNITMEAIEALGGTGRYSSLPFLSRISKYFGSFTNIQTPLVTLMSVTGLGTKDSELDFALDQYYNWARKNKARYEGGTYIDASSEASENRAFKQKLTQAVQIMEKQGTKWETKAEQSQQIKQLLTEALQIELEDLPNREAARKISSSLKSRRIIKKLDKESREKLYKAVHPEVYQKLKDWDFVLENWADSVERNALLWEAEARKGNRK